MYSEIIGDIETLDVKPSAVVLSIGLTKFNLGDTDDYDTLKSPERSFYAAIDADHQIAMHGRTVSAGTVKWWMDQNKMAQAAAFKERPQPVEKVLKDIVKWVGKQNSNLWGNGNVFDNMILMSLFEDYGVPFPFRFWENLDLRTLKYLANSPKLSITKGIEHHALDDAQYEVLCAQEYYRVLQA